LHPAHDLGDRTLFASLQQRSRDWRSRPLREMAGRLNGNAMDASREVVAYFAARLSDRFFVRLDELPALA
jgi:hypothetical protein